MWASISGSVSGAGYGPRIVSMRKHQHLGNSHQLSVKQDFSPAASFWPPSVQWGWTFLICELREGSWHTWCSKTRNQPAIKDAMAMWLELGRIINTSGLRILSLRRQVSRGRGQGKGSPTQRISLDSVWGIPKSYAITSVFKLQPLLRQTPCLPQDIVKCTGYACDWIFKLPFTNC